MLCTFSATDLYEAMQFFPVHLVNWFMAALLARDAAFLWLWSVYDELVEWSYERIIPEVLLM